MLANMSTFEAKSQLYGLLDRVRQGEQITITTHGVPIARLTPISQPSSMTNVEQVIQKLEELRERTTFTLDTTDLIRELREEGRRF